jgi:RHS repeat-associated protein
MRSRLSWSLLVILLATLAGALCGAVAFAGPLPPDLPPIDTSALQSLEDEPRPASTATVVRELPEERTETSASYLLSDGTRRAVIFAAPVFYLADDGTWRPIDKNLVIDAYGLARPVGMGFDLVFSSERFGAPVRLGVDGGVVGIDLVAAAEGAPVIDGQRAIYPEVATDTDLVYETLPEGVKGTLELKTNRAPCTYTFFISHESLTAKKGEGGLWGFYGANDKHPIFVMEELVVFDSSTDNKGEPAYCHAAKTTVREAKGGSYVTYEVPRTWLAHKDRVWPIKFDPTITRAIAASQDNYISWAHPDSSYPNATSLRCGLTASDYYLSLIKFNVSALKDPAVYVSRAHLRLHQTDGSTSLPTHVEASGSNWNAYVTVNSFWPPSWALHVGDPAAGSDGWISPSCRNAVQGWVNNDDNTLSNYGFIVHQDEWLPSGDVRREGAEYYHAFNSSDAAANTPRLVVEYEKPSFTISNLARVYRVGDTVTVKVKVNTAFAPDITDIRIGINRNRSESRYRGMLGWFRESKFVPSGAWQLSPYDLRNGGWFAFYRDDKDSYGTHHITPRLRDCHISLDHSEATFSFKVNDDWGDVQDNVIAVKLGMRYSDKSWPFVSDWTDTESFDVWPVLSLAPKATLQPTAWYAQLDTDNDGAIDVCDNSHGRGDVTLKWDAASAADGYRILLWDGKLYRQVGRTLGKTQTRWSTDGLDFYPSDADIADLSWPFGANGNPFYRAMTPDDPTKLATVVAGNAAGSAGVLAGDDQFLYVCRRMGRSDGPTAWQKYRASDGAWLASLGAVPNGSYPLTAFCYRGLVYGGALTVPAGGESWLVGSTTAQAGGTKRLYFTADSRPLDADTGAPAATDTTNVLLAERAGSLYSVAHTITSANDAPAWDGYKIKRYTLRDGPSATATYADYFTVPCHSRAVAGVVVDERSLYLLGWTADSNATVTRIDLASKTLVNQWTINQGAGGASEAAVSGVYDQPTNSFWLGSLGATGNPASAKLYRYAGAAGGMRLRDNPNALYRVTDHLSDGYAADRWTHYALKVVPYSDHPTDTVPPADNPAIPITLDKRTMLANEAPAATSADLGSFAGHAVSAVLAERQGPAATLSHGRLELATTDLAVASWGPPAVLDRYYSSSRTETSGLFAPGWRFGFERQLAIHEDYIDYTDEVDDSYRFTRDAASGAWAAPNGFYVRLNHDEGPDEWLLTFKDDSHLVFNAGGKLLRQTDSDDNSVTYAYDADGDMIITAANGQSIVVVIDDGHIVSAAYQTPDGTRRVDYKLPADEQSWPEARFRVNVATSDALRYDYCDGRLSALQVGHMGRHYTFILDAQEGFSYSGPRLSAVTLPDYSPDNLGATLELAYPDGPDDDGEPDSAQIDRHGQADGAPQTIAQVFTWTALGLPAQVSSPYVVPADATWTTTTYAPDDQPASITLPSGRTSWAAFDTRGDKIADATAMGRGSVYAYDDRSRLRNAIDPLGCVTYTTYDGDHIDRSGHFVEGASRRPDVVRRDLDRPVTPTPPDASRPPANYWLYDPAAGTASCTDNDYADIDDAAGSGRTYRGVLVRQTEWLTPGGVDADGNTVKATRAVTSLADFALCGQPQTTTYEDVEGLVAAPGDEPDDPPDLHVQRIYDALGDLVRVSKQHRASDPGPPVWLQSNTYDMRGRLLTTTGPPQVAHNPDGSEKQDDNGQPVSGALVTSNSYDSRGNLTTSYRYNSADPGLIADYVEYAYDGQSRVIQETRRDGPSGPVLWTVSHGYDPLGHEVSSTTSTIGGRPATRHFDVRGNAVKTWPEDVKLGVGGYALDDFATKMTYDDDDRLVSTTTPSSTIADKVTYNDDDTLAREERPDGSWISYSYDAAGGKVGQVEPTETYDKADKPYEIAEFAYAYDLGGRLTQEADAGRIETDCAYDLADRKLSETRHGPDKAKSGDEGQDTTTTYAYNDLGWSLLENTDDEFKTTTVYNPDGTVASQTVGTVTTAFTYDELGRLLTKTRKCTEKPSADGPPNPYQARSTTRFAYDDLGRLICESRTRESKAPGAADFVATDERQIAYTHDSQGRQTGKRLTRKVDEQWVPLLVCTTQYPVDEPGDMVTILSYGGLSSVVRIDGRGRDRSYENRVSHLSDPADPSSVVLDAQFSREVWVRDPADRATDIHMEWANGVGSDEEEYGYGNHGRLTRQYGLGFSDEAADTVAYAYNTVSGQQTREHLLPELGGAIDDGYTYRTDGRLEKAGDEKHSYAFSGNLKEVEQGAAVRSFAYHEHNRLKSMAVGGETTYFNWDTVNGRRLAQGPNDIPDSEYEPTDPGQPTRFTYNDAGELVRYVDLADASDKTKASYAYDSEGQRIGSVVETDFQDAAEHRITATEYLYDGLQLLSLSAVRTTRDPSQVTAQWQITYLYDSGGRPYAGVYRNPNDSPQTRVFFIISNDRGDVIELLNAVHNPIVAYRYDAWGVPRPGDTDTAFGATLAQRNVLRYAGYLYDAHSRMYYLQRRYYDTATRSFISRDPGRTDGLESPYQYCGDRPVSETDPTGEYRGGKLWYEHPGMRNTPRYDPSLQPPPPLNDPTATRWVWPPPSTDLTARLKVALPRNAGHAFLPGKIPGYRDVWLYRHVKPGGPWDLKQTADNRTDPIYRFLGESVSAEYVGNVHFGYILHAMGYPLPEAWGGSLGAHFLDYGPRTGAWTITSEFQDWPAIAKGWELYWVWGKDTNWYGSQSHHYDVK